MRDYDEKTMEFIERVFERSDEILRQRQIQATESAFEQSDEEHMPRESKISKIHRISHAILGLCSAVVIGLCILTISRYSIEPNKDPDNIYPNATSDTTSEKNGTAISTTNVTENITITTMADTSTVVTEALITNDTLDTAVTTSENEEPSEQIEPSEEPIDIIEHTEITTTETVTQTATTKPVQTEPPTTAKPVVKPTLCGDVNGDGTVDIEDAVIIINYVNKKDEITWAEHYKKNKASDSKLSAEQALANADTFKPSDKREITSEDAEAIMGYINGKHNLPTNELKDD